MKLADCHVHPNYSKDVEVGATIDLYCQRALEIGLSEICFTVHYDTDPLRRDLDDFVRVKGEIKSFDSDWIKGYQQEIMEAQGKYSRLGLSIRGGLEIDYSPHIEYELRRFLSQNKFDYVLGAVHCLDHISIAASNESSKYFKNKELSELSQAYFDIVRKAVKSRLFPVIAHLDVYKKYGYEHYGPEILEIHRAYIPEIFKLMRDNGVGFEVNSSGLQRPFADFYPGKEILLLTKGSGVKLASFGSDCHRVEDLGLGIREAKQWAKENGLI